MTTTLAKKVKMFVLYVADYSGNNLEETIYIHPDDVKGLKQQLVQQTFIDLGGRMIPRKRVLDLKIEEEDESLITFLSSLDSNMREEANAIIADRKAKNLKLNGSEHLKQIMTDRGFLTS